MQGAMCMGACSRQAMVNQLFKRQLCCGVPEQGATLLMVTAGSTASKMR